MLILRNQFRNFISSSIRVMNIPRRSITAAIVIIGDEILKGDTVDTNSHFLCRRLRQLGITVERISVIPDCVNTIADEVKRCSENYTHVITSGGIGPTHDDMTFEGVAKAMDDHIQLNSELVAVVEKFFGKQENQSTPQMKLAQVPSKAKVFFGINKKTGKRSLYPVIIVRNITILPGVPKLLVKSFDMIQDQFKSPDTRFFMETIYVNVDEMRIAPILTGIAEKYAGKVQIGSYPALGHSYYKVRITLDSTDKSTVTESYRDLVNALPTDNVVMFDEQPEVDPVAKFERYLYQLRSDAPEFCKKVDESVAIIEDAFRVYQREQISVAFNGGKDCTAILHLVYIVACKKFPDFAQSYKLKGIYLKPRLPFEEMEEFIEQTRIRYNLDLSTWNGNVKDALAQFSTAHPEIRAVFMGTRASDPNSHQLEAWAKTDPGWPELMRISPLIKWSYGETWRFLRGLFIPYCSLYDDGFTSLGNKDNTERNPALRYVDGAGVTRYKPAYSLGNELLERKGRKVNGL